MNKNSHSPHSKGKMDASTVIRFLLGYEEYWLLMIMLLVLGLLAGIVAYVFTRPSYSSTALVRVFQYMNTTEVAANGRSGNAVGSRELAYTLGAPYMQLEAARRIGLATDKTTYAEFKGDSVFRVEIGFLAGDLMQIYVETFNPKAAREFAGAMIDSWTDVQARRRREFRETAVQRYVDELKEMRKRVLDQLDSRLKFEEESALATAQIELERLSEVPVRMVRVKYRLQDMERIQKVLAEQAESLGTVGQLSLLTSLEADSKDKMASGRLVRSDGAQAPPPVSFLTPGTPALGKLGGSFTQVVVQPEMVEGLAPWKELEKKKRELTELERLNSSKYLEEHQQMRKLREEIKAVDGALGLELEVAKKAFALELSRLQQEVKDLEAKLPAYHAATKAYDEKKTGYNLVQKGQLAWDTAYESLAKNIESMEMNVEDKLVQMDLRGFTDMRDEIPVSPSKSRTATIGLVLGLGLAFGFPFLLQKLDTSVSDLSEFEASLGILGIGLIPLTDPKLLNEINRSPAIGSRVPNALLENFRLIRSAIMLNPGPKGDPRVIMVTSARPGEGKTTTSCNVGWAFSSQGDRTVVVDCDLRRGRVHGVTEMPNKPGLTDLFTGKATLDACLQKTKADNLWVVTRGSVVAGTTEILNTAVFEQIIQELRGKFDRIILDTPPVLGLSETAFLHKHAEGVLLVIRARKTERKDAIESFKTLQKLGAHFFGFLLNRVDFSKRSNSYSYYYYSSSYYEKNWHEAGMEEIEAGLEAGQPKA
jgi:capsular exopolysaccharide synthesis family protein